MNPNLPPHIAAIFKEYLGQRDLAVANLQVYLKSMTGIGEHENIGQSIKNIITEIDKYDSLLKTIMDMYPQSEEEAKKEETVEGSTPSPMPAVGKKTDLYEDGVELGSFKKY